MPRPLLVESTAAALAEIPEAELAASLGQLAALLAPALGRARVLPLLPDEQERAA